MANDNSTRVSTRPMDCVNDTGCLVSQARAVVQAIIHSNIEGEQPIDLDALYGVRSLLEMAFNRLSDAREGRHG